MSPNATEPERVVLTVQECAAYLRIGRAHAYEMVREGRIPHLRLGRKILIPKRALDRMLDVQKAIEDKSGDMGNMEL